MYMQQKYSVGFLQLSDIQIIKQVKSLFCALVGNCNFLSYFWLPGVSGILLTIVQFVNQNIKIYVYSSMLKACSIKFLKLQLFIVFLMGGVFGLSYDHFLKLLIKHYNLYLQQYVKNQFGMKKLEIVTFGRIFDGWFSGHSFDPSVICLILHYNIYLYANINILIFYIFTTFFLRFQVNFLYQGKSYQDSIFMGVIFIAGLFLYEQMTHLECFLEMFLTNFIAVFD
eukprot:TRINITY_DN27973_c1_g3_i1.p5 TRINITY_DN27973_c1_g3~~TRINITY_DN27973_c1_g3_i1.p5  ORF type:complete len:226 (-),score=-3.83 TRINITY_DN27973_c1_g3_i1:565-1242(-)